jgi:hypothetical protein
MAGIRLSIAFGLLMLVQAITGLLWPGRYRDPEWIRLTWLGNDWVTLLVAVPLLFAGIAGAARGAVPARLLWLGALGYGAYNYAFYLFGAALNAFFLLYVLGVVFAAAALIVALSHLEAAAVAAAFRPRTPVRAIGGALIFTGVGLASVWIVLWAAYVFGGRPTPVEPDAFRVVAALDLTAMVPALIAGGALLWRRRPWGYVIAALASIQGALYLLVLSVNSILAIRWGCSAAPGELPIWGALLILMASIAAILLAHARSAA